MAIKGKSGVLSLEAADVAQITSYSLTETAETAETTSFGTGTTSSRTHVATLKSWEGSLDLIYNKQDISTTYLRPGVGDGSADYIQMILYPEGSGANLSGDIIITSFEMTGETADVVQATVNFTGTGDLGRASS
jgi:predicted secreted protein